MPHSIIFFDGVCNLCNASVQFIIRHDKNDHFRFAALQSVSAKELLKDFNISPALQNSVVLLEEGRVFTKSTAVLRICRKLSFPLPLLSLFLIVPGFIRDWTYGIIANNRYKWFGKQDVCMVPTAELKGKFL